MEAGAGKGNRPYPSTLSIRSTTEQQFIRSFHGRLVEPLEQELLEHCVLAVQWRGPQQLHDHQIIPGIVLVESSQVEPLFDMLKPQRRVTLPEVEQLHGS